MRGRLPLKSDARSTIKLSMHLHRGEGSLLSATLQQLTPIILGDPILQAAFHRLAKLREHALLLIEPSNSQLAILLTLTTTNCLGHVYVIKI
jgi:hypothetical protein